MEQITKQQEISRRILEAYAATGSVKEAFDAVFGAGAYEAFAGDLYDALRAKNEKAVA